MDKIFCLIDTNIFINLEDNQVVQDSFAKFHNLCNKNPVVIYIHPLSQKEIQKDKNQNRRKNALSKIKKYELFDAPPLSSKNELEGLFGKIKKSNDEIDCQLLYAVYKNAIFFLVTEDQNIHKKSKKANIKDRVLTVNQANNMLDRLFPTPKEISLPKIEECLVYNINREDKIFDSLRDEYEGFDKWLTTCSREQVKSWIIKNPSKKLEAICIYKEANNEDYGLYNLPEKSLKLATFKVDEYYRGKKLGELMLKKAFIYAVENQFKACWMTVFPRHEILIDFIKDFGFFKIGETERIDKETNKKELVFRKNLAKPKKTKLTGLDFHIRYSPFYDDRKNIGKYVVPIQEKYHKILFPEYETLSPPDQMSFKWINYSEKEIPGNTIKKVYLCHSPTRQLKQSDLLFFYVSSPIQALRSIGIIESVFRSDDLKKVVSSIGKRSVYNFSEIKEMTKKGVLVIEFRFVTHLGQKISIQDLKNEGIIKKSSSVNSKVRTF